LGPKSPARIPHQLPKEVFPRVLPTDALNFYNIVGAGSGLELPFWGISLDRKKYRLAVTLIKSRAAKTAKFEREIA